MMKVLQSIAALFLICVSGNLLYLSAREVLLSKDASEYSRSSTEELYFANVRKLRGKFDKQILVIHTVKYDDQGSRTDYPIELLPKYGDYYIGSGYHKRYDVIIAKLKKGSRLTILSTETDVPRFNGSRRIVQLEANGEKLLSISEFETRVFWGALFSSSFSVLGISIGFVVFKGTVKRDNPTVQTTSASRRA